MNASPTTPLPSSPSSSLFPSLLRFTAGLYLTLVFTAYFPFLFPLPTWAWLLCIALALLCLRIKFAFLAGALLAITCLTITITPPLPPKTELPNCQFTFTLTIKSSRFSLLNADEVRCEHQRLDKQTLSYWQHNTAPILKENQRYRGTATLIKKATRLNHNTFDQEKHQFIHRQTFTAKDLRDIIPIPLTLRERIRWTINQRIHTHLPHYAGLVSALITGERNALSEQQKTRLQRTGTGHILAISGLHVGIVALWAMLIGQGIWAMSPRLSAIVAPMQFACIFAFVIISAYAWLTGFSLPTQRAWLMLSVILLSRLLFYHFSVQSILLALIAVLILQPLSVLSVGFYLSFIATFIVQRVFTSHYPSVVKVIVIQLCISLALLPISWFSFGHISTVSVVANLLLLPWLSFVLMPALFLTMLFSLFTDMTWVWSLSHFAVDALWVSLTKLDVWLAVPLDWTTWLRPSLTVTALSVIMMLGLLCYRPYLMPIGLLPLGLTCIPNKPLPRIIVVDAPYLSSLIHDSKHAIIINPGYRKGRQNDAHKWLRYLYQHRLELSAIVLTDTNVKRAAATQTLRQSYPNAKLILGKDKAFIGDYAFCEDVTAGNISIKTTKNNRHCDIHIYWQDKHIGIHQDKIANADITLNKGTLTFNGKTYTTRELGQLRITADGKINMAREAKRLWRAHVPQ